MVNIEICRSKYTERSIVSTLRVTSSNGAKVFQGFALENSHAGTRHQKEPTPAGSFKAKIRTDGSKGWRIELIGVPGHTHIEIHVGNFPKDAFGCFLPGKTKMKDFVGHSAAAMKEIQSIVEQDGTGNIMVRITGRPTKS